MYSEIVFPDKPGQGWVSHITAGAYKWPVLEPTSSWKREILNIPKIFTKCKKSPATNNLKILHPESRCRRGGRDWHAMPWYLINIFYIVTEGLVIIAVISNIAGHPHLQSKVDHSHWSRTFKILCSDWSNLAPRSMP